MSQHYAELIEQWRIAAAETREAQAKLTAIFNAHLDGKGPAPEAAAIEHLRKLRDIDQAKLEAAIDYARQTASGPPTGFGDF